MLKSLPLDLFNFWYPQSLAFFTRVWHNIIVLLEEDLAVGLMIKLLFVPLFHDKSFVGRILSIVFRLIRIFFGSFAISLVSAVILFLALVWFLVPVLLLISLVAQFVDLSTTFSGIKSFSDLSPIFIGGLALFINHKINNPLVPLWKIKTSAEIFKSTKVKRKDLIFEKLIKSEDAKSLFLHLEISTPEEFLREFTVDGSYLEKVYKLAKKVGARFVTPSMFLVAGLENSPNFQKHLSKFGVDISEVEQVLVYLETIRRHWRKTYIWDEDFSVKHLKGVNRGWVGVPTPELDRVSKDLTNIASREKVNDFVGRGAVVSEVIGVLSKDRDRNALLVGPAGVGKTALVYSLAGMIVAGDAPESIATKRLVELDLTKLLSGINSESDLATRIKKVFEEVEYAENIVIFVDEIQNLGIGEVGSNYNLYSLMLGYLESDKFQFLASTEDSNYYNIVKKNGAFARIFHRVDVPAATTLETLAILQTLAISLIKIKKTVVTFAGLKKIVELSAKFSQGKVLPDAAIFALDELQTQAKEINNYKLKVLTSDIVESFFEKEFNAEIGTVEKDQKDDLLNLESLIHEQFIDQEEAVKAVADSLRRSAVSLNENSRPKGSFLFVGPTGVGKTELAKILSKIYFKNKGAFLRFDMSEYQTTEAINRLIGTANSSGELTESVKKKPYCLILFDEFEKASPQVLNLFLQILEDGRLTDYAGETTDFTNTIIISTSNAASVLIAEGIDKGISFPELEGEVQEELLKILKPELVNRFDKVVIFKPLSTEDLEKVVQLKLNDLKNVLNEQGYLVEVDQSLVAEIARRGYDKTFGARPIRRFIQDTIEARLSILILEGKIKKGEVFNLDSKLIQSF